MFNLPNTNSNEVITHCSGLSVNSRFTSAVLDNNLNFWIIGGQEMWNRHNSSKMTFIFDLKK